jgi:hypothetical protein
MQGSVTPASPGRSKRPRVSHLKRGRCVAHQVSLGIMAAESGITITAPRTTSRDIRRHKASNYQPQDR